MFPIPRIRIRRINTDSQTSTTVLSVVLTTPRWLFNPQNLRVRLKWVGFGSKVNPESETLPSPVLGTVELPKSRVRFRWAGFGALGNSKVWVWGLFLLIIGAFIFTNLPSRTSANPAVEIESPNVNVSGLIADEVTLNDEAIRITYPSLDMGEPKDLFDQDTKTLIRGLEANPFVLDFQFPAPKLYTGLVMDFGGMDFDLHITVYGEEGSQPILYDGEYRNQPPEPHVELNFVDGPQLVSRISIEIEQYNPPPEPHIHIREILFKE